ncbi:MAG: hypothetical protein ACHQNA_09190, partial [Acidimicrobiales bacterium]
MNGLVEIAPLPPVPLHDLFTYRVPDALQARICPGMRVRVPLGRQTRTGIVAGFADRLPPGEIRAVLDLLDDPEPFLPADVLELCRWTARYYLTSLAEVIGTIVGTRVPPAASERAFRLVERLSDADAASLARRAPVRSRAYRALVDAPDATLTSAGAEAAGVAAAALRALVGAGVAKVVRVGRAPERAVERPAEHPSPSLTA